MKRRIITLILSMVLVFTFVGCTEKSDKKADNKSESKDMDYAGNDEDSKDDVSDDDKRSESKEDKNSGEITLESVLNHSVTPKSDFNFSINKEGNSGVLSYSGSDSIIIIPETGEDGLPVTNIEKFSFSNEDKPKAIKFADTVNSIDDLSCGLNTGLEIVVMGEGTKYIGQSAFLQCTSLREVYLNEGLETIKNNAFGRCDSLKSITIPESVTNIELGAFQGIEKNLIIYGKSGSAAEEFAKTYGIKFEAK